MDSLLHILQTQRSVRHSINWITVERDIHKQLCEQYHIYAKTHGNIDPTKIVCNYHSECNCNIRHRNIKFRLLPPPDTEDRDVKMKRMIPHLHPELINNNNNNIISGNTSCDYYSLFTSFIFLETGEFFWSERDIDCHLNGKYIISEKCVYNKFHMYVDELRNNKLLFSNASFREALCDLLLKIDKIILPFTLQK